MLWRRCWRKKHCPRAPPLQKVCLNSLKRQPSCPNASTDRDSTRIKLHARLVFAIMVMTFKMNHLLNVSTGCALSSAVEHFLHTEGVAGSKPAARTISDLSGSESTTRI